jgi:LysR family transcriptional regulator, transcriptional activator of the cysJI operon
MEDHRLKAFCLVYEMRSFSKAAEAKLMSQSAMSHLIRNLEEDLGIKLFTRKTKTVRPTSMGKLFYEHARNILEQYKRMDNELNAAANLIKGTLLIGSSTTVASYLLPQVFYSFSKQYPDIMIELTVSNREKIIDDLLEGKVEFGIVEGTITYPLVSATEIAEDEIVVIAADDNPLSGKKAVTSRDLESQRFIMPEIGSGTREFVDDLLREAGINPEKIKISMTLGSPELITHMVQSGMGISFVSKWSVFHAIKEGSIRVLDLPGKKLRRKFYLISMEMEQSTAVAKVFAEFITKYRFFVPF